MTLATKALAFWITAAVSVSGSARGDALTTAAIMVAFDRSDLTLGSADVVAQTIGIQDPKLRDRVEFASGTLAIQGLFIGARNDLPNRNQIIEDFNNTLAQMRDDGSLDILLAPHVLR